MNNSELCEIAKKHENRGEIAKAYQCYLEAALAEDDGEAMNALGPKVKILSPEEIVDM